MKKDKRFPLIADSMHLGFCVCFINETTGIVVSSNYKRFNVGYFSDDWISCFDKKNWTIIAQPSEYPKEMYVGLNSGSETDALRNKNKRTIVFHHEGAGYIDTECNCWFYAVDIPEQEEKKGVDLCDVKNNSFPYGGKKEEINTFESSQRLRRRNIFDEEFFSVLESRMKEFQDILNELKPKL